MRVVNTVILLSAWASMIFGRTQAHLQMMSPAWIAYLVLAHMISLGIGFILRGIWLK